MEIIIDRVFACIEPVESMNDSMNIEEFIEFLRGLEISERVNILRTFTNSYRMLVREVPVEGANTDYLLTIPPFYLRENSKKTLRGFILVAVEDKGDIPELLLKSHIADFVRDCIWGKILNPIKRLAMAGNIE